MVVVPLTIKNVVLQKHKKPKGNIDDKKSILQLSLWQRPFTNSASSKHELP
jgi:hypothetical protein